MFVFNARRCLITLGIVFYISVGIDAKPASGTFNYSSTQTTLACASGVMASQPASLTVNWIDGTSSSISLQGSMNVNVPANTCTVAVNPSTVTAGLYSGSSLTHSLTSCVISSSVTNCSNQLIGSITCTGTATFGSDSYSAKLVMNYAAASSTATMTYTA